MKNYKLLSLAVLLSMMLSRANAQQNDQLEQLKNQLQQMQQNFDRVVREQRQQIDALTKKVDELSHQPPATNAAAATAAAAPAAAAPTNAAAKSEDKKQLEAELAAELGPQTNAAPSADLA